MKVLGLIVSILLFTHASFAQDTWNGGPRVFSYQGELRDQNGKTVTNGDHFVLVELYNSSSGGSVVYSEQQSVPFHDGVFDIIVGGLFSGSPSNPAGELPEPVDFSVPYWIQITFEPGGANEQKFLRQPILSAPYALNAERVNGIEASATPQVGKIFPVPLLNGKIDPGILPKPDTTYVQSINAIGGDVRLSGSGGITISNDVVRREITISQQSFQPGTAATMIAVGTTAERPSSPLPGMIRFNTTTSKFEGYDGTNWVNLN